MSYSEMKFEISENIGGENLLGKQQGTLYAAAPPGFRFRG